MRNFSKNTGFKLPSSKTTSQEPSLHFGNEEASPGTPLYRKKLDGGILAEANKDGTIFIDESVEPGSKKEREVLMHEMKHLTDIKVGRLAYEDEWIKWDGQKYPRKKGKILYEGQWAPEGDTNFPWERR